MALIFPPTFSRFRHQWQLGSARMTWRSCARCCVRASACRCTAKPRHSFYHRSTIRYWLRCRRASFCVSTRSSGWDATNSNNRRQKKKENCNSGNGLNRLRKSISHRVDHLEALEEMKSIIKGHSGPSTKQWNPWSHWQTPITLIAEKLSRIDKPFDHLCQSK